MKTKWLVLLIIIFVFAIIFSLLLNHVGTNMLPSSEKTGSVPVSVTLLPDSQQDSAPILASITPVHIDRSVIITNKPEQKHDYTIQTQPEVTSAPIPETAEGSLSSSTTTSAETAQKTGVVKEGREASPVEMAKIKAKGIIIQ